MQFLGENKILTRDGVVELIDDTYMCFRVHDHIRKPTKERTTEIIEAYEALSDGKKYPLMLVANNIDRVDKEEQEIIRETNKRFFIAQAIVTNNKFTIMIVNMMINLSSSPIPTRIFSTEEAALKWLKKYIK